MRELIRHTFSRQKLRQLCVNTALSNLIGYAVGSLVMVLTTYHIIQGNKYLRLMDGSRREIAPGDCKQRIKAG